MNVTFTNTTSAKLSSLAVTNGQLIALSDKPTLCYDLGGIRRQLTLSDNYTSSAGSAASGVAASSLALYNAYSYCAERLRSCERYNLGNTGVAGTWYCIGSATFPYQSSQLVIDLYGGDGQNSKGYQQMYMKLIIKKGYQASQSAILYVGGTGWVLGGHAGYYNSDNIKVKLLVDPGLTAHIWIYFGYPYAQSDFNVQEFWGTNFTYSGKSQTAEPNVGVNQEFPLNFVY